MTVDSIAIRRAGPDDRVPILELLSDTLSWIPNLLFDRYFTWKHEENPFGRSPAWVATEGERVVGFRTFLRWQFDHPDGRIRHAVRAVDTATHPEYQGRGIFSRLTLHALDELQDERVDFVFNTPNDSSRPGYLKMGWVEVGRLTTTVRPARVSGLIRMVRSRVAAERWSLPTTAGHGVEEVLSDERVDVLIDTLPATRSVRTRRSRGYLAWRYGFDALGYRVVTLGKDLAEGLAITRLRRRGRALEVAVCEMLAPTAKASQALARVIGQAFDADYAIRIDSAAISRSGFVRIPRQGPMLTYRPLADDGPLGDRNDWELQLGDIELL